MHTATDTVPAHSDLRITTYNNGRIRVSFEGCAYRTASILKDAAKQAESLLALADRAATPEPSTPAPASAKGKRGAR